VRNIEAKKHDPCSPSKMNAGKEILDAMLLGKMDALTAETIFLFSRTGLIHLFSASGFHMGAAIALSKVLKFPLQLLPRKSQDTLALLFTILFMLYFGHLTGWSSPLVRALAFASCLQVAAYFEIRIFSWRVFFFSALIALLFGKSSFLSLTLSLLGMMGILLAPKKSIFSLALYPWIFTLPLVIWHFHLISFSAPIWNLTFGIVWGISILPLAIFSLLLKQISLPTVYLDDFCETSMELSIKLLAHLDQMIGGSFWVNRWHFLLFFFALFFVTSKNRKTKRIGLVLFIIVAAFRFSTYLILLNVDQGDSLVFVSAAKETFLIDAGKGNRHYSMGAKALERAGIGSVDHLLITHADLDHLGGSELILLKHPVKNLWIRQELFTNKKVTALLETAKRANTNIRLLQLDSPEELKCWLPPPLNSNESSPICLAKLRYNKSLLLTGDAGFASEHWFLREGIQKSSVDFLKIGHHGSKYSSSNFFLDFVNPKVALISAGWNNRYLHPHQEVLARLKERNVKIRRTDLEGSIYYYGLGFSSEESILPGFEYLFSRFLK
jgi:competence protein ComEC